MMFTERMLWTGVPGTGPFPRYPAARLPQLGRDRSQRQDQRDARETDYLGRSRRAPDAGDGSGGHAAEAVGQDGERTEAHDPAAEFGLGGPEQQCKDQGLGRCE